jgi:hypothetical protein
MLSIEDALAMLDKMHDLAREDEAHAEDNEHGWEHYWEGYGDALWTLKRHIETDVKVTCFPIGTCACHPFKLVQTRPYWRRVQEWFRDKA